MEGPREGTFIAVAQPAIWRPRLTRSPSRLAISMSWDMFPRTNRAARGEFLGRFTWRRIRGRRSRTARATSSIQPARNRAPIFSHLWTGHGVHESYNVRSRSRSQTTEEAAVNLEPEHLEGDTSDPSHAPFSEPSPNLDRLMDGVRSLEQWY